MHTQSWHQWQSFSFLLEKIVAEESLYSEKDILTNLFETVSSQLEQGGTPYFSVADCAQWFRSCNEDSNEDLNAIVHFCKLSDRNFDGYLDRSEFLILALILLDDTKCMPPPCPALVRALRQLTFRHYDADGDRLLNEEEWHRVCHESTRSAGPFNSDIAPDFGFLGCMRGVAQCLTQEEENEFVVRTQRRRRNRALWQEDFLREKGGALSYDAFYEALEREIVITSTAFVPLGVRESLQKWMACRKSELEAPRGSAVGRMLAQGVVSGLAVGLNLTMDAIGLLSDSLSGKAAPADQITLTITEVEDADSASPPANQRPKGPIGDHLSGKSERKPLQIDMQPPAIYAALSREDLISTDTGLEPLPVVSGRRSLLSDDGGARIGTADDSEQDLEVPHVVGVSRTNSPNYVTNRDSFHRQHASLLSGFTSAALSTETEVNMPCGWMPRTIRGEGTGCEADGIDLTAAEFKLQSLTSLPQGGDQESNQRSFRNQDTRSQVGRGRGTYSWRSVGVKDSSSDATPITRPLQQPNSALSQGASRTESDRRGHVLETSRSGRSASPAVACEVLAEEESLLDETVKRTLNSSRPLSAPATSASKRFIAAAAVKHAPHISPSSKVSASPEAALRTKEADCGQALGKKNASTAATTSQSIERVTRKEPQVSDPSNVAQNITRNVHSPRMIRHLKDQALLFLEWLYGGEADESVPRATSASLQRRTALYNASATRSPARPFSAATHKSARYSALGPCPLTPADAQSLLVRLSINMAKLSEQSVCMQLDSKASRGRAEKENGAQGKQAKQHAEMQREEEALVVIGEIHGDFELLRKIVKKFTDVEQGFAWRGSSPILVAGNFVSAIEATQNCLEFMSSAEVLLTLAALSVRNDLCDDGHLKRNGARLLVLRGINESWSCRDPGHRNLHGKWLVASFCDLFSRNQPQMNARLSPFSGHKIGSTASKKLDWFHTSDFVEGIFAVLPCALHIPRHGFVFGGCVTKDLVHVIDLLICSAEANGRSDAAVIDKDHYEKIMKDALSPRSHASEASVKHMFERYGWNWIIHKSFFISCDDGDSLWFRWLLIETGDAFREGTGLTATLTRTEGITDTFEWAPKWPKELQAEIGTASISAKCAHREMGQGGGPSAMGSASTQSTGSAVGEGPDSGAQEIETFLAASGERVF